MANTARRFLRLKYMVFAIIAMMTAYVLFHNERFLVDSSDPSRAHYRLPARSGQEGCPAVHDPSRCGAA